LSPSLVVKGDMYRAVMLSVHEPPNARRATTLPTSENSAPKASRNGWLIAQGCRTQTPKRSNLFETSGDLPLSVFLFIRYVNEAAKYQDRDDG
jgi:hypothetical protein